MFTEEFEIALYQVGLQIPDMDDDPDLMDIEGLCVSFDEHDFDTMSSAMDHEALDGETFSICE